MRGAGCNRIIVFLADEICNQSTPIIPIARLNFAEQSLEFRFILGKSNIKDLQTNGAKKNNHTRISKLKVLRSDHSSMHFTGECFVLRQNQSNDPTMITKFDHNPSKNKVQMG